MSQADAHGEGLGHVVPFAIYRNVFIALLVLTVVTVLTSSKFGLMDFGVFALLIAMVIASVKALLVAMYFMHLKYENPLTWAYVAFPIILLVLLMGGVFIDNPTRHDPTKGTFIEKQLAAAETEKSAEEKEAAAAH